MFTFTQDILPTVYTLGQKVYTVKAAIVTKVYTVAGTPGKVYTVGAAIVTKVYMVTRATRAYGQTPPSPLSR